MIHYLTVQDIIWINTEVTKETNEFKYAQLEEAAFYQYGYGKSENVLAQAAHFLQGFLKLRPFASGNRATAFISALTFLKINSYEINLNPDIADEWVIQIALKTKNAEDAITEIAEKTNKPYELKPRIRTEVKTLINTYQQTLEKLSDVSVAG